MLERGQARVRDMHGSKSGGRLLPVGELVRRAGRWRFATLLSCRIGLAEEVCFEMIVKCFFRESDSWNGRR